MCVYIYNFKKKNNKSVVESRRFDTKVILFVLNSSLTAPTHTHPGKRLGIKFINFSTRCQIAYIHIKRTKQPSNENNDVFKISFYFNFFIPMSFLRNARFDRFQYTFRGNVIDVIQFQRYCSDSNTGKIVLAF